MLYVFHVDVGRMLNFDMAVAMSTVENLKKTIERVHGIPASNIVLLASGGEILTHSTQVSFYSAGTDTNPIYMFLTGDMKMPAVVHSIDGDQDLRDQVERSIDLPPVYETVVKRAQLAARMYDLAREEERITERLVHEQHLQQQGWSTVVANMEDLTKEFQQRFKNFCEAFDTHLLHRDEYLKLLQNFNNDLEKLSRIPILPGLMPLAEADFHGFDDFLDLNDDVFARQESISCRQQESNLLGGNVITPPTTTTNQEKDNNDDNGKYEKNTSSTSPNKKLKMGTESTDEGMVQASVGGSTSISGSAIRRLNLLQWITSKENHDTLKNMSEESAQGLATFDEKVYNNLKIEVENIIKMAGHSDVKEIKGIGDRLCKLEEFRFKIKNMVKDQKELSTALHQNQTRASQERDPSILPDLCTSHQSQLLLMLQQHQKIRDHRRCIAKAKEELSINMHSRLRRIVLIENTMSEFDNKLLFYHRCLRRAERHIHIIEQIHEAPNMYLAAVTEVMRRKIFSTEFRLWASKLAEDFDVIHNEEMKRRQQFNDSFEGHFLNILFPGMNDMPPAFANENPLIFDARLPNITRSDLDILRNHLPEMTSQIQLPDMAPVIYFFVSRSGSHQQERFEEMVKKQKSTSTEQIKPHPHRAKLIRTEDDENEETMPMVISALSTCPQPQRLIELRKEVNQDEAAVTCESVETDTEAEFEKVSAAVQSVTTSTSENRIEEHPVTMVKSTITDRILMQSAETLTEENEEILRQEVKRIREQLDTMSKLALNCIHFARKNLKSLRQETQAQHKDINGTFETLNQKWQILRMENEARESCIRQIQFKHKTEIQHLITAVQQSNDELETAKQQQHRFNDLESSNATLQATLRKLENKLKNYEIEKTVAVSEACEDLIHKHKTEIESLRQRFKLMTSMDQRSPSNTSLAEEKIESQNADNFVELGYHETILAQQRAEMEDEKQKAITAALEAERHLWQSKIIPLNSGSVMANVNLLRDMLEEKERQLDQLRERDLMITKENYQLKTRLDALTNEEGNSWLEEKIEYLNRDKRLLEEELNMEKSRRLEMESSFAVTRGSTNVNLNQRIAVLQGCSKGDLVFVVWSIRHHQFLVVQDSPTLYFVHGDSLPGLNLHIPDANNECPIPMPYYALGRVIEKEYCLTRKEENRYRLPRGCKFNRVKLLPVTSKQLLGRQEKMEPSSTTISRSVSQYDSPSDATTMSATTSTDTSNIITITDISSQKSVIASDITAMTVSTSVVTVGPTTTTLADLYLKERTSSVSSVTEENNPCQQRCINECADSNIIAPIQQRSVITEQPTSSTGTLEMYRIMLGSAADTQSSACTQDDSNTLIQTNINTTTTAISNKTQLSENLIEPSEIILKSSPTQTLTNKTAQSPLQQFQAPSTPPSQLLNVTQSQILPLPTTIMSIAPDITTQTNVICASALTSTIGTVHTTAITTSDDSDEYRSLEPKDGEPDFPLAE